MVSLHLVMESEVGTKQNFAQAPEPVPESVFRMVRMGSNGYIYSANCTYALPSSAEFAFCLRFPRLSLSS